jgi:hypothetical protein
LNRIQSVNLWRTILADGLSRIKISSYIKSKGRSKLFVATKKLIDNDNVFTQSFNELVKMVGYKEAALKKPYTLRKDVVLPIKVPTTPVENVPQAVLVLPIEVPTTPVDTFAQTDELLSIEVSTTRSTLSHKQTRLCPLPHGAVITALV